MSQVDAQAVIDELAEQVRQHAVEIATLRALLKQRDPPAKPAPTSEEDPSVG